MTQKNNRSEFPKRGCHWVEKEKIVKIINDVPFAGLKTFIIQMRKMIFFQLLEIVHGKPGIRYLFPDFTIGYQPNNPHWGTVNLTGKNSSTMYYHGELSSFLRRFKKLKHDPKFVAEKGVTSYQSCKESFEFHRMYELPL